MYYRFVSKAEHALSSKWHRMSWKEFHKQEPALKHRAEARYEYLEIKQQPRTQHQTIQRKHWRQLGDLARLQQNLNTLVSEFSEDLSSEDLQAISLIQLTIQILQDKIRGGP